MNRLFSPIAVAALAALAGCVGVDAPERSATPSSPAKAASVSQLTYSDCEVQAGQFPISPGAADPFMPDGFTATIAGAPAGRLIVIGFDCEDASGAEFANRPAKALWWVMPAEPPGKYRVEGVTAHWVVLGMTSDGSGIADVMSSWGAPRFPMAEVSVVRESNGPAAWSGRVSAASDAWDVSIDSSVAGAPQPHEAEWNRAYVVERQEGGPPRVVAALDFREEGPTVMAVLPPGSAELVVTGETDAFPVVNGRGAAIVEWSDGLMFTVTYVPLSETTR